MVCVLYCFKNIHSAMCSHSIFCKLHKQINNKYQIMFVFIPYVDGYGEDDIRLNNATKPGEDCTFRWRAEALTRGCVAVNSLGFLKRKIHRVDTSPWFEQGNAEYGIWVTVKEYTNNPAFHAIRKILETHSKTTLVHGRHNDEFNMQYMIGQAVSEDDVVLDMGGQHSLLIAFILRNDSNLVALESDPAAAEIIRENRARNEKDFHIENQAFLNATGDVPTITLDELQSKYSLEFSVLIAKCSDTFVENLQKYPGVLNNLKKVVIQHCNPERADTLREILSGAGFVRLYSAHMRTSAGMLHNVWETWALAPKVRASQAIEYLQWNALHFHVPVVAVHVNPYKSCSYYMQAMTLIPKNAHVLIVCADQSWCKTQCWLRALREHVYFTDEETALKNCSFCTHHILQDTKASFDACVAAETRFSRLTLRVITPVATTAYTPRSLWLQLHSSTGLVRQPEPWITICITAYEMQGRAAEYLTILLESIVKQDYTNWNVIVSDHSLDNIVEQVCAGYPFVQHMYFKEHYGCSSPNFNHAMDFAGGLVIKPMCMDDYFYSSDALRTYAEALGSMPAPGWCALSCQVVSENGQSHNFFVPRDTDCEYWRKGGNTLSAPSVVAWSDDGCPRFRPALINLMDVCMYADLKDVRGSPVLRVDKGYVAIRTWNGSVSNTVVTEALTSNEIPYAAKIKE
jgi:hypothetical protein